MPEMRKKLITEIDRFKELMEINEDYKDLPAINDTYPNVDFHSRTKGDRLNPKILDDIQYAAQKAGIVATVNYARTGHDKYSDSGAISRHYKGLAVDVSQIKGLGWSSKNDAENKNIADDIENFVKYLKEKGYIINQNESGNEKVVLYFGASDHDDHVHISNTNVKNTGKSIWTNTKKKNTGKSIWTNTKKNTK